MIKSAESVSPKHPDKICDQIADAILDAIIMRDKQARVAIEVLGGHGQLIIMGEVTTKTEVNYMKIAQQFVSSEMRVLLNITRQSPEIARGVDSGGAGDQGVMVGYATAETADLIPLETYLARDLNRRIFNDYPYDGKTQITLDKGKIKSVVASFQKAPARVLKEIIEDWLIDKVITSKIDIHTNPAGDWQIGGFDSDVGLTGRKLAIDNYGPHIPVGGGSFSGKDPTKVDRSGAYMARKIAVDYLCQHRAREVFVYLAYAIGISQPVHAEALIDGKTRKVKNYDLSPGGIMSLLDLQKPIYHKTSCYGHFGNSFSWDG